MLAQFEALNAQVVGVSADHAATLEAFTKQNNIKHLLLSDFRRQVLPTYDALVTDEKSPIYRYAKRAYFVIDRSGSMTCNPPPLQSSVQCENNPTTKYPMQATKWTISEGWRSG